MKVKLIYLDPDLCNNGLTLGNIYDNATFGEDGAVYIIDDEGTVSELYSNEYEVV